MARVFFTYIVPFFLPLALYLGWAWYRTRFAARHGGDVPAIERGPWPQLLFIGALLALATLAATTLTHTDGPGSVYTPPHVEDGRIVPGRAAPPPS
jgi:hypothetical protein